MMAIANGLEAAGITRVVEFLRDGDQDPIWNLSESIDELVRKTSAFSRRSMTQSIPNGSGIAFPKVF